MEQCLSADQRPLFASHTYTQMNCHRCPWVCVGVSGCHDERTSRAPVSLQNPEVCDSARCPPWSSEPCDIARSLPLRAGRFLAIVLWMCWHRVLWICWTLLARLAVCVYRYVKRPGTIQLS